MSKLAKKNTAKRKIQMRQYFEQQVKNKKHYSDPFLHDDNSSDEEFEIDFPSKKGIKIKLQRNTDDEYSSSSDDLLSGNVNLDEADYLIISLKMPKKNAKQQIKKVKPVAQVPTQKEQANFKQVAEKLHKLKQVEIQGAEEDEEEEALI